MTPKSGRSLIRSGCLQSWRCKGHKNTPVRLPIAGGWAGASDSYFSVGQEVHLSGSRDCQDELKPEASLAWVLARIQDHPVNCIQDLLPWAYQDKIIAQDAEAEGKEAA